jgi:hypothetical protein
MARKTPPMSTSRTVFTDGTAMSTLVPVTGPQEGT